MSRVDVATRHSPGQGFEIRGQPKNIISTSMAISSLGELYPSDPVEGLLFGLRPMIDHYGLSSASVNGVRLNVPKELYDQSQVKGAIISFNDSTRAGLTPETLLATSAILQGAGKDAQRASFNIPRRFRPIGFNPRFADQLTRWVKIGADVARTVDWNEEKIGFYKTLGTLLSYCADNNVFDLVSAFSYCLDGEGKKSQHLRGFGIFKAFFRAYHELLNLILHKSLISNIPIEGFEEAVDRIFSGSQRVRVKLYELALELADIRSRDLDLTFGSFINDTVEVVKRSGRYPQDKTGELAAEIAILSGEEDISLSNINLIRRASVKKTVTKTKLRNLDLRDIIQEEGKYWDPREYDLNIDVKETRMLRTDFGIVDAFVVPPITVRKNIENFTKMQIGILRGIAEELGLNLDIEVPYPKDSAPNMTLGKEGEFLVESQKKAFKAHQQILKEMNRYLLVLLFPEGQKLYFKLMPYTTVPPYVVVDNEAIPISNREYVGEISEIIKRNQNAIRNRTPFLHHIQTDGMDRSPAVLQRLTIPGEYIRVGREYGCDIAINHGAERFVMADPLSWNLPVYSMDYMPRRTRLAKLDIDAILFNGDKSPAEIAVTTVDRINMREHLTGVDHVGSSFHLGKSMAGTEYASIWSRKPNNISSFNVHAIAHNDCTMMQIFRAWCGGDVPEGKTNLLIETLLGVSRFRSSFLLPEFMKGDNGSFGFGMKFLDPFNGIEGWIEGGGGVNVHNVKRNVVALSSIDEAYPSEQAMSIYKVLRDAGDLFYTDGKGIYMPERVPIRKVDDHWEEARLGVQQVRERIRLLAKNRKTILQHLKDPQNIKIADLREEMSDIASLINDEPYAATILLSGGDKEDLERGLAGIELSRFYPILNALRENTEVWDRFFNQVREGKTLDGETGMHFIARVILNDAKARELIVETLRREFLAQPLEIGSKLAGATEYYSGRKIDRSIPWENLDWGILDSDGIGPLTVNMKAWSKFLMHLTKNNIHFDDSNFSEVISLYNKLYPVKLENAHELLWMTFNNGLEREEKESGQERWIKALMLLMVYPGFG